MSLLIKGMDMPERGIHHGAIVISAIGNHLVVNSRPYNKCFVLSEIPTPHGRLIDADKLKVAVLEAMCRGIDVSITQLIDKAPTVIEKEMNQ